MEAKSKLKSALKPLTHANVNTLRYSQLHTFCGFNLTKKKVHHHFTAHMMCCYLVHPLKAQFRKTVVVGSNK